MQPRAAHQFCVYQRGYSTVTVLSLAEYGARRTAYWAVFVLARLGVESFPPGEYCLHACARTNVRAFLHTQRRRPVDAASPRISSHFGSINPAAGGRSTGGDWDDASRTGPIPC